MASTIPQRERLSFDHVKRSLWFVLPVLLVTVSAGAQDETARYAGHFVLDGGEEAARERVRRALRPAIQSIPILFRGMAEDRLNDRFQVVRAIDIALPEDRIRKSPVVGTPG